MSVKKFRSVAQMPSPPARRPLDPENLRIAFELSKLAQRLHARRFEPGVRKLRSSVENRSDTRRPMK